MRKIIGITGNANSGKDTTADYILSLNQSFKKIAFADPLKNMVIQYLFLTKDDVFTTQGKNRFNEYWGMTNRQILQKVGTDAMRKGFCYDIWVKITQKILLNNKNQNFIISDVRFLNEAEMIKRNGGIIVRIKRNYHIVQCNHQSENPIDSNIVDYEIENYGDLQQLYKNIQNVLGEYIK